MTETLDRFGRDYTPALLGYLTRQDERGLGKAYELGRAAMSAGLSMLDVVTAHHAVLLEVVGTVPSVEEARSVSAAAASFLVETLAPFEMAQRGYLEVHLRRPARD